MTRAAKKAANKTNASTSISIQHNAKSESQNNKQTAANQIVRHNVQQHGKSTENQFHNDPPLYITTTTTTTVTNNTSSHPHHLHHHNHCSHHCCYPHHNHAPSISLQLPLPPSSHFHICITNNSTITHNCCVKNDGDGCGNGGGCDGGGGLGREKGNASISSGSDNGCCTGCIGHHIDNHHIVTPPTTQPPPPPQSSSHVTVTPYHHIITPLSPP